MKNTECLKLCVLIVLALLIDSCAMIASVTGASTSTVTAIRTVETVKLGADAVGLATTDKTLTDRAMDQITSQDCHTTNIFKGQTVCQNR